MNNLVRTFIWIAIFAGISGGISYGFHATQLAAVNNENIIITPDTFSGTADVELDRVVEVTGTPDLLNAVSMEERNTGKVLSYFAPLQEYGTNIVVQIKKSKLSSEEQVFVGRVTGINKTEYEKRIKTVLNKPLELSDDDRAELDPETIELLIEDTTNEFPNKSLLVIDGEIPVPADVYGNILFWTIILSVALITLFRRQVFRYTVFS